MSILHTVNKSAFTHQTLSECLSVCGSGHSILFIEDGVYGVTNRSPCREAIEALQTRGVQFYVLDAAIEARGIKNLLIQEVHIASDEEFVDLVVQHTAVQSWF